MRHLAVVVLSVALLGACGLEQDEEAVIAETSEALDISGPIFARPRITSISPISAAPGATVTLTGGGFETLFRGPAAFGSTTSTAARANLTYISPTQMTAVVPAGAQTGPIYIMSSLTVIGGQPWAQLTSPQTFTPVPAAPSNLTRTVVSSTRVNLSWTDNSSTETAFDIWILDAAGWRSLKTVGANVTSDAITGLQPATSYSFRVRALNGTVASGNSNTVSATTTAAIGTVRVTNNAQIAASQVNFNGAPRAPTTASGNQATYDVTVGNYFVEAVLVLFSGDWVCSLGGNTTVVANQTSNLTVNPLTAGQVLTHCSGAIDYVQGSYVDQFGFHTVEVRVHASGTFNWWLDGALQAAQTITRTSFSEPWLTFDLSGGDTISMSWPFGSMQVDVNGHAVQMIRDSGG